MNRIDAGLGTFVQEEVVKSLGDNEGERIRRLRELRPAVKSLRQTYLDKKQPNFANPELRVGYACAYHPHHVELTYSALTSAGPHLLGLNKSKARVVVLGAGPAGELVGLAQFATLHLPLLEELQVALVDREPGWHQDRPTTAFLPAAALWEGTINRQEIWLDLDTAEGLSRTQELVEAADLVISQTLITELINPSGRGGITDHLLQYLGAETRFLFIDLKKVGETRRVAESLAAHPYLRSLLESEPVHPASGPIGLIKDHLLDGTNLLIPRKKIEGLVRLVGRPGLTLSSQPESSYSLTKDQDHARRSFRDFLAGPQRVCVISGAAGTGKTALIPHLIPMVHQSGLAVGLLAPTGQAARRLSQVSGRASSTIHHRIYEYGQSLPAVSDPDALPVSVFRRKGPSESSAVYLVDEASLIGNKEGVDPESPVQFAEGALLNDLLRYTLGARDSKIVFIGDPNQLPPVGELASPALLADSFNEYGEVRFFELNEVVRQQAGSEILDTAEHCLRRDWSSIRESRQGGAGEVNLLRDKQEVPHFLLSDIRDGSSAVVCARHSDVREWNQLVRSSGGDPTDRPRPGEPVLVTRSNSALGLRNGDILRIATVAAEPVQIRVRGATATLRNCELTYEGPEVGRITFQHYIVEDLLIGGNQQRQHEIDRILFVNFKMRSKLEPKDPGFSRAFFEDSRANALRVTYAYAQTCHRAQGSEWVRVLADFSGAQSSFGASLGQWAYTASTRARQHLWLSNLPDSEVTTLGIEDQLQRVLEPGGLGVTHLREIQGGWQVAIASDADSAWLNLYKKKGRLSSVNATGPTSHLHAPAIAIIEQLIEETKAAALVPVGKELDKAILAASSLLQERGYDFTYKRVADYQVEFTAVDGLRSASLRCHHGSDGTLGKDGLARGDYPDLLHELRKTVDRIRAS